MLDSLYLRIQSYTTPMHKAIAQSTGGMRRLDAKPTGRHGDGDRGEDADSRNGGEMSSSNAARSTHEALVMSGPALPPRAGQNARRRLVVRPEKGGARHGEA